MAVELYDYQIAAVKKMRNGCILCGGVGSGKSRTALAYYYLQNGGNPDCLMGVEDYVAMDDPPKDLYIITTARKRDTMEWEGVFRPSFFRFTRMSIYIQIRLSWIPGIISRSTRM